MKMKGFASFLLLVNTVCVLSLDIKVNGSVPNNLIVQTTTGLVKGEVFHDNWYRFRGIPYAEPPVGPLRFEPPVPKKPWSGILDVTKRGPSCIQGSNPVKGSEDCLYLKIYSPKAPRRGNKLPVIVWIYGGAFYGGEPDFDNANPKLLLKEGVILAAIHYRVGLFGFLSTENSIIPGNAGLKDQIIALQWIKSNIENFGGDSSRITIMGQSAGSASVAYILQAPQTAGLYSGAIMLSGSTLDSWTLTRKPLNFAKSVASSLKISSKNIAQMVSELKNLSPEKIQEATSSAYTKALLAGPLAGLPLGPVVEPSHLGAVITGKSYDLLKNGQFVHVPIVMGHTSSEAYFKDGLSLAIKALLALHGINPGAMVPAGMHVQNPVVRALVGQEIKNQYFGWKPMSSNDIRASKWISEDQFVRGINEAVKLYSKQVPVYYYNFGHEGALFGVTDRTLPGVGHTEDLGYLFDFGFKGSQTDYLVRDRFVRLITNFAKYRTPTRGLDILLKNYNWLPNHHGTSIVQLNITDTLETVIDPLKSDMDFWATKFEKYGQKSTDTY